VKDGVYLYFGDKRLTLGSFDDLRRMNMKPEVGLQLTFYDNDADDEGRQVYLCADGRLCLDVQGNWFAEIDEGTFRTVEREQPPG
jgi:hypothetical protein